MENREPLKSPPAIVVIEDDQHIAGAITRRLTREGCSVRAVGSLRAARELFLTHPWDLAVLDRELPDGDAMKLCGELRAAGHGYIVMLTDESTHEGTLKAFHNGADDYLAKPFNMEELVARIRAGLRVVDLQKALIATNRELERLSLTDSLTGLHNRRAFELEIASRFEQARRYERALSVAIIDVDYFKSVNDDHGHQAGDSVLRAIGQVLEGATRSSDFVARYGGEEFAVILPETSLNDAKLFAEKVRSAIALSTIRTGDMTHDVTISVGVASFPYSHVENASEIIHAADRALYRAKAAGRNCVALERRREPMRDRAVFSFETGHQYPSDEENISS